MKFVQIICILFFSALKAQLNSSIPSLIELDLVDEIFLLSSSKVNETVKKLFDQFRLSQNIRKSKAYIKELNMFKYLENTKSINYKVFKKIASTCKIAFDKKLNHDNVVEQVLNETLNNGFTPINISPIILSIFNSYVPRIQRQTSDEENLSLEFIRDFINKIDGLTVDDFVTKNKKESEFKLKLIDEDKTIGKETEDFMADELVFWDPTADKLDNYNRRLSGNSVENTSVKTYPFMASVHVDNEFVCPGSIISINIIVTAASCITKLYKQAERGGSFSDLTIRFGSDYAHKDGHVIKAIQVNFHPNFDLISLSNNIALIKVKKSDVSRVKWLKRVRFEKNCTKIKKTDQAERNIKVLGWGVRDANHTTTNLSLSLDKLSLYDLESCQNIYTRYYVTRNNFCAGSITDGIGACDKDIGGPGLYAGTLIGIVSFGSPECGTADTPTVFTSISPYSEWIDGVLNENNLIILEGNKYSALRGGDQPSPTRPSIFPLLSLSSRLSLSLRPVPYLLGSQPTPYVINSSPSLSPEPKHIKVFRGRWNSKLKAKQNQSHRPFLLYNKDDNTYPGDFDYEE